MKLRELLDLCEPDMEIKIIVNGGNVPCMTVSKLISGEYAYLLDREIIGIDYLGILKKWFRSVRTMAVWVEGWLFRPADRETD